MGTHIICVAHLEDKIPANCGSHDRVVDGFELACMRHGNADTHPCQAEIAGAEEHLATDM